MAGEWLLLTNGIAINLNMIEAITPGPDRTWRFFPPRTQRGGRPYGRPPERPPDYNEDAGYWSGTLAEPDALHSIYPRGHPDDQE